jgi:predicted amidohydrolase
MKYKIGVCQFKPELYEVEQNLQRIEKLLKNVKADLVVLPELAASGYLFCSIQEVEHVSECAQTGPTAMLFIKLAKENNCSYVVGFSEEDSGKFYNSAMLVNPDGKIFVYRKIHLFYEEKKWFEPGNTGFKVFEAKGGVKVGLMICFDWIFPESARSLALKGASIIAHPANLVLPWCQQAMITRSLENKVFSATANRTGLEQNNDSELYFTGQSQILSTKGEILKRLGETEESVFVTEIEIADASNKDVTEFNNIFEDRRTDLYS